MVFSCFSFQNFFRISSKIFSDFWPRNFKKMSKLTSACAEEQFLAWRNLKKFWTVLFFCRNLWNGSQNSIYVSRVKSLEETVFLTFLFRIFSNFERNIFRLLAKKLQEVVKTTLCLFRRTIFGLKFFSKVLNRFGFSAENLAWFSNFYLRVQRKNSGRNNFFILLFRFFSEFERNFFSDFWPKNFKNLSKLTSVCVDEQFLAWNCF